MSVTEVTARISQIQAQIAQLAGVRQVAPRSAVVGGPLAATADGFAATLDAVTAGRGVGAVDGSRAPGTKDRGLAIVEEAKKYLGVPYLWGGTDPAKGLDCSGLVQLVYRSQGIELPRVSYQQATAGRPVASLAAARPGDILAFNSPVDHVAIYAGNNMMIEAPRTGLDVRLVEVPETPSAIRRVLPDQPVPSVPGVRGDGPLPSGTPYARLFTEAAAEHGVSATLLAAVARQESGYDARAVSPAGARGLMQLMPATAAGLGVGDPWDPAQSVDGAARLLRDLLDEFGRVDLALAAYNAGPGAVKRYNGIPPYPETRAYVPAVLAHQSALERA